MLRIHCMQQWFTRVLEPVVLLDGAGVDEVEGEACVLHVDADRKLSHFLV